MRKVRRKMEKKKPYERHLHFYHIDCLNENGLKELVKMLRQENLELEAKIIDLKFKSKGKEIKNE